MRKDSRVVETSDGSSMSGEGKFGDQNGRSHASECESETNEESTTDKHADILGSSLNDGSNDDD